MMRARMASVALATAALIGCGGNQGERVVGAESGAVESWVPRPAFTLTGTDGKPYDFGARTAGRLTFLEFGYTNCPDVCPVHMANLATVLRKLAPSDRMKIDVVFISIDPDRDSLPALRKWLDSFDPSFVGLTGSRDELDAVQRAVGFGPAIVQALPGKAPEVTHAAPVIAFTADDTAHVMYPFGTRQADWERDIPRLLARRASTAAPQPPVDVQRAYVVTPAGNAPAAIYFTMHNPASRPDTLLTLAASTVGSVSLHESVHDHATGNVSMRAADALPVPPGGTVRLAPGGLHGMIAPVTARLVRGNRIALTLLFARSGVIRVEAAVIAPADVDSATTPR